VHRNLLVARDIAKVCDPRKDTLAAREAEYLSINLDNAAASERENDELELTGGKRVGSARFELEHPQRRVRPAGALWCDVQAEGCLLRAPGGDMQLVLHSVSSSPLA
jgi:hypothetical protein